MTEAGTPGPGRPPGTPLPFPGVERPVVGMVHLAPLPGSPAWGGSMHQVVDRALSDARALAGGGMDGLLVENYHDIPFHPGAVPADTVAAMAVALAAVVGEVELPVGVNVLRNDARGALALAVAAGARFIRVNVHTGTMFTDQGPLVGAAHETLRARAALGAPVAILADVFVKHAVPPPGLDIEDAARDCVERGLADGLVVSGAGTGRPTAVDTVRRVGEAVGPVPVWIGSGLTPDTVGTLLAEAHGAIVGSTLQRDGRPGSRVDPDRVARFMEAVGRLRGRLGGSPPQGREAGPPAIGASRAR